MRNKIILHIPHSSAEIPHFEQYINNDLLEKDVLELTDWFTDRLFANDDCENVVFPFSRFYCDVERLRSDPQQEARGQGIIYTHSTGAERIRKELTMEQRDNIIKLYDEHHSRLSELVWDRSIIIDCHSFSEEYAACNDVDICIGYNDDRTRPSDEMLDIIKECFKPWRVAENRPFANSIAPDTIHLYKSVMIEINKRLYMDIVDGKAVYRENAKLKKAINKMYDKLRNVHFPAKKCGIRCKVWVYIE